MRFRADIGSLRSRLFHVRPVIPAGQSVRTTVASNVTHRADAPAHEGTLQSFCLRAVRTASTRHSEGRMNGPRPPKASLGDGCWPAEL
jgi:hypothetical protein